MIGNDDDDDDSGDDNSNCDDDAYASADNALTLNSQLLLLFHLLLFSFNEYIIESYNFVSHELSHRRFEVPLKAPTEASVFTFRALFTRHPP